MRPRRIAIGIDDFGLHAGIDAAVLRLAALERVTAVSCLVGLPRWTTAAALLTGLDPASIDVGLHLDLTDAPVQAGVRRPLALWIAQAATARLPRALLSAEIDAQLDRFEQALRRPPDHVDGHRHVHQLPGVRELLVDALQRRWPTRRPWLRCTRPPTPSRFKPWLIGALGASGLGRLAEAQGYAQNRRLLGVYGLRGSAAAYAGRLATWLHGACDGDLLVCHPSLHEPAIVDTLLATRVVEAQVLGDPGFAALLEREGIVLTPISRIRL